MVRGDPPTERFAFSMLWMGTGEPEDNELVVVLTTVVVKSIVRVVERVETTVVVSVVEWVEAEVEVSASWLRPPIR
jgi:hypothetical protein